jgi:hypothetical protein
VKGGVVRVLRLFGSDQLCERPRLALFAREAGGRNHGAPQRLRSWRTGAPCRVWEQVVAVCGGGGGTLVSDVATAAGPGAQRRSGGREAKQSCCRSR